MMKPSRHGNENIRLNHIMWLVFILIASNRVASQTPAATDAILKSPMELATEPPIVINGEVCEGNPIPELSVTGTDIRWYTSPQVTKLVDNRDGRTYEIVTIGGKVWMAENLNFGSLIKGYQSSSNNGQVEKYCYSNSNANCDTYGGLYQWGELMGYSTQEGAQGICPSGWHIPSNYEWKELEIALGMSPAEADLLGNRGTTEGAELRVNGGSGFEALMAGKREPNGNFASIGTYATFWSSSEDYNRTISTMWDKIYLSYFDEKENGFSVRCIKDDSEPIHQGNTYNTKYTTPGTYTYYVTQTIGGEESNRVPIILTIHPAFVFELASVPSVCEGEKIILDAGAGYSSYLWNTGSRSASIEVTEAGSYDVTLTNSNGCEASGQVNVTFFPLPNVSIAGQTEACDGTTVQLDAGEGFSTYKWNTGETSRRINVNNSGKYSVSVSDGNGCSNVDEISVVFNPCSTNHPPEIDDQDFNVAENENKNEIVGIVIATDQDPDQSLQYIIESGNENNAFKLKLDDGVLTVGNPEALNYEVKKSFDLVIKVQDNGEGRLSDLAKISVSVKDQNESPKMENQSFSVDENSPANYFVGSIIAHDEDFGQILEYEILFGNSYDAFKVDNANGEIFVNNPEAMDYDLVTNFQLNIRVSDNASEPLHTDGVVNISVNDLTQLDYEVTSGLHIYPNPTKGKVMIELEESKQEFAIIELYHSNGSLVKNFSYSEMIHSKYQPAEININEKGLYYLKIRLGDQLIVKKIICL